MRILKPASRKSDSSNRARFLLCALAALLIVLVLVNGLIFFTGKNKFVVPFLQQYDVFFGDFPAEVAAKVPGELVEKEQLSETNQSVYQYEITVMDTKAQMNCFYLNDKNLVEVDFIFPETEKEQISALFDQAKRIIQEAYKDEASFVCDNIVYLDENTYSLSLGLREGAVGIDYRISVQNNELYVLCVDCR